tara:strand:- start:269170 stop:271782 length:2613 start_codon:yes stop_codon:yes gene_type:complete
VLPFAVATDFGGILYWTQYVASLAVVVAGLLAITALINDAGARTLRRHMLLLPVVLWMGYSYFQTVSLPPSLVQSLSGGSAEAYTTWIDPLLDASAKPESFPISIDPFSSRHATAFLAIISLLVWTSAMVFTTRARLVFLLSATSVGGAIIATLGIWRLIDPSFSLWSMSPDTGGGPFSTFVNRNNAALMLNLGFASGLGLICWRLSALTGSEIDDELFEFSDMVSLLGDRYALVGVFGLVMCGTGLLVCGSRGGLVAAVVGVMLALGWVRQRRGVVSLPVVGTLLVICIAILVVPTNLSLKSIERMDTLVDQDGEGIWNDGRLRHLPDGIRAARAYLPAGSGLSTYAYAHLPYEEVGSDRWYKHADNLWLELLAEQGIPGVLLALVIFGITIHSLYYLSRSPDPMDQGLRITGWYAIGAIIASQAFDFGLILPANLLLVACLLPAIIVRRVEAAVLMPTEDGHVPPPKVFQHRGFAIGACVLPVILFLTTLPSVSKLRSDAKAEHVEWTVKQQMSQGQQSPDELELLSTMLAEQISQSPSPALLDWRFRVEHERLRYLDVIAANPDSESEVIDLFRQTSRTARRLSTGSDEVEFPSDSRSRIDQLYGPNYVPDEDHKNLVAMNEQSLKLLPLGRDARTEQISLKYIHGDNSRVTAAIEQLHDLFTGNPNALLSLGVMAAETANPELAIEIFRETISYRNYAVRKVLELTKPYKQIDQSQLLPDIPEVHRLIAPDLLRQWERRQSPELGSLLERVKDGLKCDMCRTGSERADCEERFGDIAASQGSKEEAVEAYTRALKYAPTKFSTSKKRISLLRSLGDINRARAAAREARILIPNEAEVFNKIIEELAEEEVRGIGESTLGDPSSILQ